MNKEITPTEEQPDPLRIAINMEQLRSILKMEYDNTSFALSDGIISMREHFPTLYANHSIPTAKRQSQVDRDERNLYQDCWAYGELDNEVFATIYEKVTKSYGVRPKGIFYDLGCGVGQLVYTAAFIGNFATCCGYEYITPLLETGERKLRIWNKIKSSMSADIKALKILWICDNFITQNIWTSDATFVVLHWTAFNPTEVEMLSSLFDYCMEGLFVITFTHPLKNDNFELIVQDACRVNWGEAAFYVYEKVTPAAIKPISQEGVNKQ